MKTSLTFIIGLLLVLPSVASAASFSVAPSNGVYHVGDMITLDISVLPEGGTVYTAMLEAGFSPDIFEVMSFTMYDAMLQLKMPSYNVINNASGILLQTGGYPGGTNTVSPYGKLVLRAKSAGTGMLTVQDTSELLDANSFDMQAGTQTFAFTVVASAPASVISGAGGATTATTSTTVGELSTSTSTQSKYAAQLAAVGEFIASNPIMLSILAILIIIFGSWWYIGKNREEEEGTEK